MAGRGCKSLRENIGGIEMLRLSSSDAAEAENITKKVPEVSVLSTSERRSSVDIDFSDLSYSVRTVGLKGKKEILKGVSGSFRSGQLTAILGSSGAGKSTLMDILAGYMTSNVNGSIKINGQPRRTKIFNKISSYIMQDDLVQPHLTVEEAMDIAARLKIGNDLSDEEKSRIMREVLDTLGLKKTRRTRCEKLSGGQKKRLSVALELVNNPPVLFLDEPTTGLDNVAANEMVKLLHKLARQGRTIICTIHQPSASLVKLFDKIYILSRGKCMYQGSHDQLVPFLSSLGLHCPITYNPTDYIMEVIQEDNESIASLLSEEIKNGKLSMEAKKTEVERVAENYDHEEKLPMSGFAVPFMEQCSILLRRRLKQQLRSMSTIWLLLVHHVVSGSFLGSIFFEVAEDANRPFDNFKFIISTVVFFMHTHIMYPVLLFPTEMRLLRREYFNHWYSLKSYFVALTLSTIPIHIVLGFIFTAICYLLSGQPPDITRFFLFSTVGLLLGLVSEGWGLVIGSLFSETNGSIVGPATVVPLLVVSVYGMGFGSVMEPFMKALMSMSYLRYGIVGLSVSLYGFNRSILHCDQAETDYCHYKDPRILLRDLGMEGLTINGQVIALVFFLILHRLLAFLCLRYRLNPEFSNRVFIRLNKFLRRK